jgi:hypothetical protein
MNPIQDFLLFDPDLIADIDITFLRVTLAVLAVVHTIAWFFVLLLLPFKLLSWVSSNKGDR